MPKRKVPLQTACQCCGDVFENYSINRLKCDVCAISPKPVGPDCQCGCGEKTAWQPGKGWSDYKKGHFIRVKRPPHPKEINPDWRPWNFGMDTRRECVCETCGITFKEHYDAKYCSLKCRDAPRRRETRLGHAVDGKVYRQARDENDHWRQEHRLVMEKHLGRALGASEVVHHRDHDRLNNDISNLFLFHCNSCHISHHQKNRPLEYLYADIHSEDYLNAKARRKAMKICVVCALEFKATIGNQNRCADCMQNEKEKAPECACGCREKTKYRNGTGYSKFVHGHYSRKHNPNQKKMCAHQDTLIFECKETNTANHIAWCVDCGALRKSDSQWLRPKKLQETITNLNRRLSAEAQPANQIS